MLWLRRRWYIGALVVLVLVLLAVWGCTWRRTLPLVTDGQLKSICKQGVPQADVERLLGRPVRVEITNGRTEYVSEAKEGSQDAKKVGWDDMLILCVNYDATGAVSHVQVNYEHQYTPLGKILNDLIHE